MPPSLLDYLTTQLQRNAAGVNPRVVVNVLRSDPIRSHALFPHATNAKSTKCYHEDILVVLSQPAGEDNEQVVVPLVGIEAALYTIPSTQTSLLYISKVDTTGLTSAGSDSSPRQPNPTRPLVAAFLSYFLVHPPHNSTRVRIHIFARAQSQYLFPGSVDNKEKKILDDKGLIRWWKRTIETAVGTLPSPSSSSPAAATATATATATAASDGSPRLFYLIPGLSYLESLPYVPASQSANSPPWTYSHPHSSLSSPLHSATDPPSAHPLTDHIPAFPDDPKSRFLHSLTSSSVSSSGTEGDYDDVFLALASTTFTTGATPAQKLAETERAIERERKRLIDGVPGGVEEWWERMAFRQECCAGQLVGFFVVASGEPTKQSSSEASAVETAASVAYREPTASTSSSTSNPHHAPKRHPLSLRPTTYTKLWSQLHNFDYARPALPKLGEAIAKWETGLEQALKAEEDLDDVSGSKNDDEDANDDETGEGKNKRREKEWQRRYEKFVRREFKIDNPHLVSAPATTADGTGTTEGSKRPAEQEAPKVNVLAPRKKKKVATA